jgi:hypothetical protein
MRNHTVWHGDRTERSAPHMAMRIVPAGLDDTTAEITSVWRIR